MPFVIDIKYSGVLKMTKRKLNKIKERGLLTAAMFWHREYMPIHFTNVGARRYHYAPRWTKDIRTGKIKMGNAWTPDGRLIRGRKVPLAKDGRPLVSSGTSMQLSRRGVFSANSRRSSVSMPIRAFNWKNPANPIDMVAEFKKVLKYEEREIQTATTKRIDAEFNRLEKRERPT